jgi:hypothetical protein
VWRSQQSRKLMQNQTALRCHCGSRSGLALCQGFPASSGGLACDRMVEWYGPTHEGCIGNMTVVANQVHLGLMTLPDLWAINHEGEGLGCCKKELCTAGIEIR